jgi:hypothetical protein
MWDDPSGHFGRTRPDTLFLRHDHFDAELGLALEGPDALVTALVFIVLDQEGRSAGAFAAEAGGQDALVADREAVVPVAGDVPGELVRILARLDDG